MKFISPRFAFAASVFTVLVLSAAAFAQTTPPKWKQGDVFLGGGSGHWQVFRPSANDVIDSLSDGIGGATNGSAIDNAWRLVTTDSGSGNVSKLVRFRISPHDPNSTTVPDVLSVTNGSGTTSSVNPQSVAVDNKGNFFLANASQPTILKFGPTGNFLQSFSLVHNVDSTLASSDLSADGNTIYYTSGGGTIRALPVNSGPTPTISIFASYDVTTGPNKVTYNLYGIRVVPAGGFPASCTAVATTPIACPSGGFLVAAKITTKSPTVVTYAVLLLNSSGAIVRQYPINLTDLKVVALNPLVSKSQTLTAPDSFWAASPSSGNLFRVRFDSTLPPGPSDTFTPGLSGIQSIATYGGFGANQQVPEQFDSDLSGAPTTSSAQFLFNTDQLTLTGYNFPSNLPATTLTAFATAVPPASAVSDSGLPCTPTIGSPPSLCTVWEIDVTPPLPPPPPPPAQPAIIAMKIFANAAPQSSLNVSQVLRNQRDDVTLGVANLDPIAQSRFSVYSIFTQPNEADKGCSYFPPVANGSLNNPGNVTFRFQCTALPGAQLQTLFPRISIVQLASGAAPSPFFPGATDLTGGTCCTVADYRYDSTSNTWVINVSFKDVTTPTSFIATTFDDNHIAGAFFVQFSVNP